MATSSNLKSKATDKPRLLALNKNAVTTTIENFDTHQVTAKQF